MRPDLKLLSTLVCGLGCGFGCGGSVVIHQSSPVASGAAAAAPASGTASGTTRVNYRMRMQVQGPLRSNGSAPVSERASANGSQVAVFDAGDDISNVCEGVTVDETGETRSGRALGMGLLQVYARPGAELLVDRAFQGETPLIAVGVDAGPRDVRLRNVPLGYDCTFRLRVLPGKRYSLLLDVKED